MKILITGGLGYIGSHICNRLYENHEITVIDNLTNSSNNKILSDIDIIEDDIRNRETVENIIKFNKIDIIIHTAAQISILKSIEDPIYDADNNINGTLNILEVARKYDIEHFIYISSAAVYGVPLYLPIDEKHVADPISPYGLSKLTGERYSMLYHNLYGLPITCIRPFNIFGPGQMKNSYSGVITKFIENMKNDNNPTIFGDGNQTRDFVYINDVIEALILITTNDKAIGQIFNIGTGNPTKIKDLAEIVIKIYNKNLYPRHEDPKIGDIIESYANITRARKILKFEPKYSLHDGLKSYL